MSLFQSDGEAIEDLIRKIQESNLAPEENVIIQYETDNRNLYFSSQGTCYAYRTLDSRRKVTLGMI